MKRTWWRKQFKPYSPVTEWTENVHFFYNVQNYIPGRWTLICFILLLFSLKLGGSWYISNK